ncbi:MAG TPA: deoxyribose-phosphate aldolase [Bacteroidales bacterium]|nr:deoxyribose-phosphate aldolase [Bacteroidales bacterium]
MENNKDLINKITNEVILRLKAEIGKENTDFAKAHKTKDTEEFTPEILASYIDHTLLKPEATSSQFDQLCKEALIYKFKSVCVNSSWVSYVAKKLRGSGIKICAVVGFPLGEMDSRSKAFETRSAISNGANEIDMVINIGALKSGNYKLVEEDIRAIKRACRSNTILKVIIETGLLKEEEKIIACQLAKKAEADFVKTCTGFLGGVATVEDVILMRKIVGSRMGVKASGGIRDFNQAVALIKAGANRLGCGASVAVVTGQVNKSNY